MNASEGQLTLESRVQVGNEVLFQELEGEAVLLSLKSGVYFGLDSVGTRIWQLLAEQKSLGEVAAVIVSEYEVAEGQCASDLLALLDQLERNALVSRA